jgi:hypothetical protein
MKNTAWVSTATLASVLVCAPALAQDSLAKERAQIAVQNAPRDGSLGLSPLPILELLAGKDKQTVSLDWSLISSRPHRAPGTGIITNNFNQFTLSASKDLGDGEDTADLINLKGFNNGVTVGLKWTWFGQQTKANTIVTQLLDSEYDAAVEICKIHERNQGKPQADLDKECSRQNGGEGYFVNLYNPSGFRKAKRVMYVKKSTMFGGLKIDGNQEKFNYLDRASFSLDKESKFGYEASAFVGWMFRDTPTIVKLDLGFARKYDATDPVNLCQATTVPGQTQCLTGPDGKPAKIEQRTISAQVTHAFASDDLRFPQFAVSPRVTYDWKNEAFEASLPVYFARNTERGLSGGVRLDYENAKDATGKRTDDFSIGLFVGVPLSFGL